MRGIASRFAPIRKLAKNPAPLLALCIASAVVLAAAWPRAAAHRPPRISIDPAHVLADGYETATLTIAPDPSDPATPPRISIANNAHAASIEPPVAVNGAWEAQIRAGIVPARLRLSAEYPGGPPSATELTTTLSAADRYQDGTPDFLRLDDARDQQSFRRWFTYLAEAQFFQAPANRPAEINDCAALIRYAYREALHAHDAAWAATAQLPMIPAIDSVTKYQYPFTPLGAALFRVQPDTFRTSEIGSPAFAQFADAQTLWRRNTHRISRDLARALPGDLLFFRQNEAREPFHSMIYLGESQIRPDGRLYILYHTGSDSAGPGEIRRLTVAELLHFPQPEWRPSASNFSFLGVHRWNILRKDSDPDAAASR